MARIVLENLSKTFKGPKGELSHAVSHLDLTVEDGEFMVLVGPSGCGKSTTLRMIAGLEAATDGTISIDERVVNKVAPKDRDVAMVFQNYALYPHMTVYENMAFQLRLRKVPKREIEQRVCAAAETLGMAAFLDRLPKALSGGQRQRVAVGRAIVRQPKVFLFDEPLSNLDAKMRVQMRREISRLHQRLRTTMVYVTHDQTEAMTMGDRIALMKLGVAQQVDDPIRMYQQPANLFVAGFIGTPPMNFFHGTINKDAAGLWFVERTAVGQSDTTGMKVDIAPRQAAALAGKAGAPVVLGVRPEALVSEPGSGPKLNGRHVNATVELVEPLGAETFLHLTTGSHSFVARLGAAERRRAGEQIRIGLDPESCYFFDPATERILV